MFYPFTPISVQALALRPKYVHKQGSEADHITSDRSDVARRTGGWSMPPKEARIAPRRGGYWGRGRPHL
jgi:hypothetical protein